MKRAILCYLPEPRAQTIAFIKHITSLPTSEPLILYGPYKYPDVKLITVPPPDQTLQVRPETPFNLVATGCAYHAFCEGLKIARHYDLTDFLYIEDDCFATMPNWDTYIWNEWDSHPEAVLSGSPVIFNAQKANAKWLKRAIKYVENYQNHSNLPAAFEIGISHPKYDWTPYPQLFFNGAIVVFKTKVWFELFVEPLQNPVKYYNTYAPYDFAVGKLAQSFFGDRIFDLMPPLTCTYSGCGDHCINWKNRQLLAQCCEKVMVHKWDFV